MYIYNIPNISATGINYSLIVSSFFQVVKFNIQDRMDRTTEKKKI